MASRAFLSGEGAFCVPPHRPFSHCTVFPAPGFFRPLGPRLPRIACWSLAFCFVFIPRGAAEWLARVDCHLYSVYGRTNSESCSENTSAISESYSENSPKNPETPKPGVLSGFFYRNEGEMLSVFFGTFFRETVPLHFCSFSEFCPS